VGIEQIQIKPLQDTSHTEIAGNQKGKEDLHFSHLYCFSRWSLQNCTKYTVSVW